MDKNDFISKAPQYYALAIAIAVREGDGQTRETIRTFYRPDGGDRVFHLEHDTLVDEAIQIAYRLGLVEVTKPDFGSIIINRSEKYWDAWRSAKNPNSPFEYFSKAGDGALDWLQEAIGSISENYFRLKISKKDFDSRESGWEPIPLDRPLDDKLEIATKNIENTIEEIRADNGYAATSPDERNYVLDKLRSAHKRLSEDTQITWIYVKNFILEPLGVIIERFGAASVGIAANAARKAILEWLKSKGINILNDIFK